MTGTLAELWVAALVLLLTHFGVSSTSLRPALVKLLGEGIYSALYSVVALVVLVWLTMAWRAAPPGPILWVLPTVGAAVTAVIMPIALLLLVGGVSQANPTAIASPKSPDDPGISRGVLRITRNPVMWAIGLWAVSHMVANGELKSLGYFGTLAVLALLGSLLLDLKNRRNRPREFAPFDLATSNIPFLAIVQGRQSLASAFKEVGLIRLIVVLALYAGLLQGHAWLFGVSAYPG
jgi:uncharacterized membrane protein